MRRAMRSTKFHGVVVVSLLATVACNGSKSAANGDGKTSDIKTVEILNVSYDPTR